VRNRRRVVYYAILLLLILGGLLGERNYIIIIFPEYDNREQYKTWLRMDSAAMGLLNGSIDSTQSGHVANLSTSKEI